MRYGAIVKGIFIERCGRFTAKCIVDGKTEICHIGNTGRLDTVLTFGCTVFLEKSDDANRRTRYSLISAIKDTKLINIDSTSPNGAVAEFLDERGIVYRAEQFFGKSRFDFKFTHDGREGFLEVKGVTLECGGICAFPDAPTKRGVKHLHHLCEAVREGYDAAILFVIQMEGVRQVRANTSTHKEFGEALKEAEAAGVTVLCMGCRVSADTLKIAEIWGN